LQICNIYTVPDINTLLETGRVLCVHLGLETYSRQRNLQKDQQSTDSQRPTASRETHRRTSRVQTVRDLQQAGERTEGPAEYRQLETYSRQRNAQKVQQSTDS
jgi:hypothetical protein